MRPHPKIRRAIKRAGLAASAAAAIVWIGSIWNGIRYDSWRGFSLAFAQGRLAFWTDSLTLQTTPSHEWLYYRCEPGLRLGLSHHRGTTGLYVYVPLWMFVLPFALPAAAACWLDRPTRRRALLSACLNCGYDLTGLAPGATCPECGAAGASPTTSHR